MKLNILFVMSLALFFSACTVNVNQPNENAQNAQNANLPITKSTVQPLDQPHWSVVVCSSRAKAVTLSAGTNETDGEIFGTWKTDAVQRQFFLPLNLQKLSRIYLKASASDKNQVEMCVLYDGKARKRVEFDDDEDAVIAFDDSDELDKCRCTQ